MAVDSVAMNNFRMNVRAISSTEGITISQLASSSGIARPYLSKVLNGHYDCTIPIAEKIAIALKRSLPSMFETPKKMSASA